MLPLCNESSLATGSANSTGLPSGSDHTTPSSSLYSGRHVSRQEPIGHSLPTIDKYEPPKEKASLKRNVSHIQDAVQDEKLKRKRPDHENEHQQDSLITTLDQLKNLCQERKITVKPTLDKLVNSCPNESKVQLVSKLGIYFSNVERTVKNTGTITSMLLKGEGTSRTKKNINDFLSIEDRDVKAIACYPFINSISSICNGKGFPKAGDVDTLLKLPSLQKDGQLDRQLLSSISSICHGKGFPNETLVSRIIESIGLNNLELPEYIYEILSSETFDFDENFWDSLSIDETL